MTKKSNFDKWSNDKIIAPPSLEEVRKKLKNHYIILGDMCTYHKSNINNCNCIKNKNKQYIFTKGKKSHVEQHYISKVKNTDKFLLISTFCFVTFINESNEYELAYSHEMLRHVYDKEIEKKLFLTNGVWNSFGTLKVQNRVHNEYQWHFKQWKDASPGCYTDWCSVFMDKHKLKKINKYLNYTLPNDYTSIDDVFRDYIEYPYILELFLKHLDYKYYNEFFRKFNKNSYSIKDISKEIEFIKKKDIDYSYVKHLDKLNYNEIKIISKYFEDDEDYYTISLIKKYLKISDRLLLYLQNLSINDVDFNSMHDYADHIRMLSDMKYDLKDTKNIYPINFHKAHQLIIELHIEHEIVEDERRNAERNKKINEILLKISKVAKREEYQDYIIEPFSSVNEIKAEGKKLKHCIGGYIGYINDGSSLLLKVRKKSDKSKPLYSVEINNSYEIKQARGYFNKPCDNSIKKQVINEYVKILKKKNIFEKIYG